MRVHFLPLTLLLACLSGAASVTATPLYTIAFPNPPSGSTVNLADPFMRDSVFALPPSWGTADMTVFGYAGEGCVQGYGRIDAFWASGYSGSYSGIMRSRAQATDFVVTGPAGPATVPGTLNMRFRGVLSKDGGYGGNNGHGAWVNLRAGVGGLFVDGSYWLGNATAGGSGVLASAPGPVIDLPVTLSANFSLDTPFTVYLQVEAGGYCYGNGNVSPGMVSSELRGTDPSGEPRGFSLVEVNGQVLTLPPGYTVNAPSWGIVDNHFSSVLDAGTPVAPKRTGLMLAGENPTRRGSRLELSLVHEAEVRVTVHDVTGRLVCTLAEGVRAAGRHTLDWDGRTSDGRAAPTGIYLVRAETEGVVHSIRVVRLR